MKIPEFTSLQWIGIYLIAVASFISILLTFEFSTIPLLDALEIWFIGYIGFLIILYDKRRLKNES